MGTPKPLQERELGDIWEEFSQLQSDITTFLNDIKRAMEIRRSGKVLSAKERLSMQKHTEILNKEMRQMTRRLFSHFKSFQHHLQKLSKAK